MTLGTGSVCGTRILRVIHGRDARATSAKNDILNA
jgi:hypothetical protein